MQQALEALEKATRFMSDSDYKKLNQAIDDLRAALAEPEQKAKPITAAEMSTWVKDTWEKCQAEAWQNPFGDDAERYARKLHEEREYYKTIFTERKPQTTHWEGCEAVHPECRKPDTDCHAQGICQRSGYSIAPTPRINELEAELSEQARVNGMGGEREARLMTELERKSDAIQRLWKERDELRALNAELAEALRGWMNQPEDAATYDACMARAEAALAKVEANNGS